MPKGFISHTRRGARGWSQQEEIALLNGIRVHGVGNWTAIVRDARFRAKFRNRSNTNLKDKYRHMAAREDPRLLTLHDNNMMDDVLAPSKPKQQHIITARKRSNGGKQKPVLLPTTESVSSDDDRHQIIRRPYQAAKMITSFTTTDEDLSDFRYSEDAESLDSSTWSVVDGDVDHDDKVLDWLGYRQENFSPVDEPPHHYVDWSTSFP